MMLNRTGLATIVLEVVLFAGALAAPGAEGQARKLLDEAGVTGGLVVHLGSGDGRLTAALHASDGFLVQGLEPDEDQVAKAREYLQRQGLYGQVSVERWAGGPLPYADNLVNLVVAERPGLAPMPEIMRVLAPGGAAMVKQGGKWTRSVKPWPKQFDQWTHFLHGPDGNAVSHDLGAGPPRHVQWLGRPRQARGHEQLASVSVVVSAAGRLFYIVDEGPTASVTLPARWFLVARDAFNGVVLWKRRLGRWESHLRGFRTGPPHLHRRLVAVGHRVYVTLGVGEPVSVLEAATGKTIMTFAGTEGAEEIVCDHGTVFIVVAERHGQAAASSAARRGQEPPPVARSIMAIDASTGHRRWRLSNADTAQLVPMTLASADGRLFFQTLSELVCLDAASGSEIWRAERPISAIRPAWSVPTVVVYGEVVLSADRRKRPEERPGHRAQRIKWVVDTAGGGVPGDLIAFSVHTGKRLWSHPCAEGYNSPPDVLVADGLVWVGTTPRRKGPDFSVGLDPHTGEVKRRIDTAAAYTNPGMSHHRCYRDKATDRFIFSGRAGVELIELRSGRVHRNQWVRGTCQYGVLPCNGLLYAPPESCACFIEAKLAGFKALAPAGQLQAARPEGGDVSQDATAFERGPAWPPASAEARTGKAEPAGWPTYRHDAARSGYCAESVPAKLERLWQVRLAGPLSAPVVAGGKCFVASIQTHTVQGLDAVTGQRLWSYTAGGRVDSPPTVYDGHVLFGCADGWVYCLRASDGALAWRLRAAPAERRIVAFGQLESAWPVHGSVLVLGGRAWCLAGRSSLLDGGMYLCQFDPITGRQLAVTPIRHFDPKSGDQLERIHGFGMDGALSDVLSSDGHSIFVRHNRFDLAGRPQAQTVPHLFSPTGFLDDTWWHRTYWLYGTRYIAGWGGWWRAGNHVPSGRILAMDGATVYGFGRNLYPSGNAGQWRHGEYYQLFAAPKAGNVMPEQQRSGQQRRRGKGRPAAKRKRRPRPVAKPTVQYHWTRRIPLLVRALVVADKTLFVCGPPDLGHEGQPALAAYEGKKGARLVAFRTTDGSVLADYGLQFPPVFDGLAAAGGRLYLCSTDGAVTCFGGR